MASIAISDELYKSIEQSAQQNDVSLHKFVEDALSWAVSKARPRQAPAYKLKPVDQLPKEIRDIIGIAKSADNDNQDLNGRAIKMEYLKEKYENEKGIH